MLAVIKKLFKNFFFLFLLQNSLKFMEKKEKYFFLTVKMAAKNGHWLYFSRWLYLPR
jgi:hypothetical protein